MYCAMYQIFSTSEMYDQIAYAISNRRYMIQDIRCVKKKIKSANGRTKVL